MDFSPFWEDDPDLWDTVYLANVALPGLARVTATHGRKLDSKSPAGSDGATITDKGFKPATVEITLRIWTKEQLDAWRVMAPTLTYRQEPYNGAVGSQNARIAASARTALLNIQQSESEAATGFLSQDASNTEIAAIPTAEQIIASETARTRSINARVRRLARHDVDISHPALDTIQVHRVYVEEVSAPTPQAEGVYEIKIKCLESRSPTFRPTSTVTAPSRGFDVGIQTAWSPATPTSAPSHNGGAGPGT